ncbi:hypothetical protein GUITHDRAFT_115730 [Guillardia theta CCMP2712]|uniref:Uncharacterized protein n=1 Tax=Guillardia theta (strain CCMP2712) TaxID=905079 RepID=L1IQT8_GUITC|nr:hypothetical protein GUITHDRAFT_115730 [Guillardia theta CCMP2712]EKX38185.1 hypothetical protein GUITHDRAFT_115730 [Guillardia theta CCMP2712]|eukprot:XP_005825165.1 hypothetical protein GUITHDRAFT_115730 [Guillardia theta CCMP2712]
MHVKREVRRKEHADASPHHQGASKRKSCEGGGTEEDDETKSPKRGDSLSSPSPSSAALPAAATAAGVSSEDGSLEPERLAGLGKRLDAQQSRLVKVCEALLQMLDRQEQPKAPVTMVDSLINQVALSVCTNQEEAKRSAEMLKQMKEVEQKLEEDKGRVFSSLFPEAPLPSTEREPKVGELPAPAPAPAPASAPAP